MASKEKEPDRTIELPCYVSLIRALDDERERVLVELHLSEQRLPAFVQREDLIVETEPVKGYGLQGLVRLQMIGENETSYQVKIKEGYPFQAFEISKESLQI